MKEKEQYWLEKMKKNGAIGIVKHVEQLNKEKSEY
jgi:hypothetical protein